MQEVKMKSSNVRANGARACWDSLSTISSAGSTCPVVVNRD